MNIFEITHRHGKQMYINGLEHAVNMIQLDADYALEHLKKRIAEERKLLDDEQHDTVSKEE